MAFATQALPADANELEQMPQITAEMVSSVFKRSSINGMQDLLSISPQLLEKLLKQCFFSGTNRSEGNSNFKEFMKAYNSIPRIKLSCQIRLLDDDKNTSEENDWTDVGIVETAVNLPIDSLCQVKLNIFNSQSSYTKNVHCPKYHRPKSRSWWTIVGANQTKLLALKRVNSIDSNHTEVLLEFMTPEESGVHQISIHLVNDSQLGIDTELVFSMNCY